MERAELRGLILDTGAAREAGDFVFLHDSQWGENEKHAAAEIIARAETLPPSSNGRGWLCIPTGGTSGRLRFARHDETTLTAAASGFCRHFGVRTVNALGVLPSHHVSGLMARIRCAVTNGCYRALDWKSLATGDYPDLADTPGDWFLSLVPTQLQRLLERPGGGEFLRRFRAVFLGGGPTWSALAEAAAEARLPISLSYGMTETAAMVAAQQPEDFLAGARDVGRPMPHVAIEVVDENSGELCALGTTGRVRIRASSAYLGYFPEFSETGVVETEDLGLITPRGALQILGRRDAAIMTGGKKVWPLEVEDALRATGVFSDVAVIGIADPQWGEAVVACFPAGPTTEKVQFAADQIEGTLANYKRPKRYVPINPWPRSPQGKLNRVALAETVRAQM